MIDKNYRKSAIAVYGEACEICGHRTSLEVHHIDYQEHQEIENKIRKASRDNHPSFKSLVSQAKAMGYDEFEFGQLSKNDDTENTSVLCGNCHGLMHCMDVGKKVLKALKPRIKGGNK